MNRYASPPGSFAYPTAAAPGAAMGASPSMNAGPVYPTAAAPGAAMGASPSMNAGPVYSNAAAMGASSSEGLSMTGIVESPNSPFELVSFDQLKVGEKYQFFSSRLLTITETNMDGETFDSSHGEGILENKQYARSGGMATFTNKDSSMGSKFAMRLKYPEGEEQGPDVTTVKVFYKYPKTGGARRSSRKSRSNRRNSRKSRSNSRNSRKSRSNSRSSRKSRSNRRNSRKSRSNSRNNRR
jgi:hypothetical protein